MRNLRRTLATAFLAAGTAFVGAGGAAQAAKFKVVHSFCCRQGSNPQSSLIADQNGNLFGTTPLGGSASKGSTGTAFELVRRPSGGYKFKILYQFFHGGPSGPLILDGGGNLYGTVAPEGTAAGGAIFKLSLNPDKKRWTETVLYQFCSQQNCADGSIPAGGLTYPGAQSGALYDSAWPLYGVTGGGGANNGGTVFQLTNSADKWSEKVLYNFCSQGGSGCSDGYVPAGGIVLDGAGNLYGATVQGGSNKFQMGGAGVVFEFSLDHGTETVLYPFCGRTNCADGARPVGNLSMDATGALYGATVGGGGCRSGGQFGCGVIFKVLPNGSSSQESVLYAFCQQRDCRDGLSPQAGLFLDSAGNLFGTTYQGGGNDIDHFGVGGGVVFQLEGSALKILHRFCDLSNCADGEYPAAPLVAFEDNDLYGTTTLGGDFGDATVGGTAFTIRIEQHNRPSTCISRHNFPRCRRDR